ncbi:MAG: hypothetical protein J7K36_06665 [Archaeoglobaceae archaeon]|nr:hypothetical protein [Archaeoglobaceae archaeon]
MFSVLLHPDVVKFLDNLTKKEQEKCVESLRMLKEDPFTLRPKAISKKLKGRDFVEGFRRGKVTGNRNAFMRTN